MSEALDRQLKAYREVRPQLLTENRTGWALVAREKLVRVFDEFEDAAIYAATHFPGEQVLIRNTAEQRGMVPFIVAAQKTK